MSLYTCLNLLNKPGVNISTAEDPSEINMPGVNQVNVNEKAGLTFAGGRMLVIDGRPVGELMFTRPNRPPIALCISESDRHGPMTPPRIEERNDLTLVSWRHGGHDFVLVGEMAKAVARDLADRTRRQYAG